MSGSCISARTTTRLRRSQTPGCPSSPGRLTLWDEEEPAEHEGEIVGSNFLDERSKFASVGPVTVSPEVQNGGIGRRLMRDVMEAALSQEVEQEKRRQTSPRFGQTPGSIP